eukprot:TRINITY_DN533_c0_g1_i1.p1 TRINITY_DN533_c0_g1~~TRINITY_DN533_c0_g1_i1.p1  ORF type:complete len:443 (+),score=67.92 TRINITY_DN533_c0_g1_i1:2718-4046(+)
MTGLGFVSSFLASPLRSRTQSACTAIEGGRQPRMTLSKRQLRHKIVNSDQYNRKGFKETREAAEGVIAKEFTSDLIKELLDNANTITRGDVTIRLAKAYGFCWGVERAVAIAYETRRQYPNERIWITNEIIHNPIVNQRMREMEIFFVDQDGMKKDLSGIREGDVVILPAFGASLEEMQYLHSIKARIVDTTCPWVSKVWNTLDKHIKANCTSIIHGKWKHEETIATASFAEKYIVVLNMDQAEYVSNYILNGGDKAEFMEKFKNAMSSDFDPDTDLEAVGVANQTTMLKSETTAIGKLFERTMMQRYGPAELNKRFVAYDTICDATQERQDAMYELLAEKDNIDIMLVVGGFNSSNTSHLQEIAEHAGLPSYWVDRPECIGPDNRILCRTALGEERVIENWLPSGAVRIGLTSGASTPDKVVEDVVERVFMISKLGRLSMV